MSTGAIIAIVVIALIIIALVAFVLPRARARQRERQIVRRREEVAGAHREVAQERLAEADRAEREARAQRAEAEVHESRASLHEEGLADDDLANEHQRFVRDRDDDGVADDATTTRDRDRGTTR
jgi:flagellar biosynthesis/type III secretory pathway M-ring protein FliF/YscJ